MAHAEVITKVCGTCKMVLPLGDFHNNRAGRLGKCSRCKVCAIRVVNEWAKNNPDKRRAQSRKWGHEHPWVRKANLLKWRTDNPERYRAGTAINNHKRRAAYWGVESTLTLEEWFDMMTSATGCLACGKWDVPLEPDHIVAMSKGGPNSIDNIQPLCASCNARKCRHETDYRVAS